MTLYNIKIFNEEKIDNNIMGVKLFSKFMELFFSFKYDFDNLMQSYQENIINTIKNFSHPKNYFYFFNNKKKDIKEKPFEASFYKFSLHLFKQINNIIKIIIVKIKIN